MIYPFNSAVYFFKEFNQNTLYHSLNDTLYQASAPLNPVSWFSNDTNKSILNYEFSALEPEGGWYSPWMHTDTSHSSLQIYKKNGEEIPNDLYDFNSFNFSKYGQGEFVFKYTIDSISVP